MKPGDTNSLVQSRCPVCSCHDLKKFFEFPHSPVHSNVLWSSQEEARRCPRKDITLGFCPGCGYMKNLVFDSRSIHYSESYENSLFFSPEFQEYAKSQATRLITQYDLHDKDILEIGCGQGEFLLLLCKLGNNRGIGLDPALKRECQTAPSDMVKLIGDSYSERHAHYRVDLTVCRQTLEHIQDPIGFLKIVWQSDSENFFFEVPNAFPILQDARTWDIIYEHCSYFTPLSLLRVFRSCGFRVSRLSEEYHGQYLTLDATRQGRCLSDSELGMDLRSIIQYAESFDARRRIREETLKRQLEDMNDMRLVIWGAGSKGVTFLNTFTSAEIEYAVDVNPRKQGKYIPGTGQRIVPPEFLVDYQPEIIIVMNPIYENEIRKTAETLGLSTELAFV